MIDVSPSPGMMGRGVTSSASNSWIEWNVTVLPERVQLRCAPRKWLASAVSGNAATAMAANATQTTTDRMEVMAVSPFAAVPRITRTT